MFHGHARRLSGSDDFPDDDVPAGQRTHRTLSSQSSGQMNLVEDVEDETVQWQHGDEAAIARDLEHLEM